VSRHPGSVLSRSRRSAVSLQGRNRGALLSAVLILSLAAGCTAPRTVLGTSDNACFQAIPVAERAVHHHGKFLGLHRVRQEKLKKSLPEAARQRPKVVCVIAYRGNFQPGQVQGAAAGKNGRYAVVVVSSPGNRLVRTYVLDKLPLRFRHL
jgi:hypothetical protein